jgi:hypothetical protein
VVVAQVSAEESAWVVAERAVAEDWASALVAAQDAVVAELVSAAASVAVVAPESASVAELAVVGDSASCQAVDSDKAWRSAVRASLAWVVAEAVDPFQAGCSTAEESRACDSAPKADDSQEVSPAWVDDSWVGDSASCRHIPGDCYKEPAAADTRCAADDKDSSIQPRRCDCSSTGAMSSSIPIPSIPRAARSYTRTRSELPARNSQPQHS